ncbi:MAG TPA: N-6 DNA methylase [Tepidisphaeraceae bacterium]
MGELFEIESGDSLQFEIYHGDTLTNAWDWSRENNPAKKPPFDAVVANSPFSDRWEAKDEANTKAGRIRKARCVEDPQEGPYAAVVPAGGEGLIDGIERGGGTGGERNWIPDSVGCVTHSASRSRGTGIPASGLWPSKQVTLGAGAIVESTEGRCRGLPRLTGWKHRATLRQRAAAELVTHRTRFGR